MKIEIQCITWFDSHFYKREFEDGSFDYYPSVTSKLECLAKPALYEWYGRLGTREARRQMKEAQDRGARIHHAWHVLSSGGAVVFSPYEKPVYSQEQLVEITKQHGEIAVLWDQDEAYQIQKLKMFCEVFQPEIIASEEKVFSDSLREAGTIDNVMKIKAGSYPNGANELRLPAGTYIFDLKNTSGIYDEAKMQVSRYAHIKELAGEEITGGLIGWTGAATRKGIPGFSLVYLDRDELKYWNRSYAHVNELWRRHYSNRKPKLIELPSLISLNHAPKIPSQN